MRLKSFACVVTVMSFFVLADLIFSYLPTKNMSALPLVVEDLKLGRIIQGEKLERCLKIQNTGPTDICILGARTCCGVTVLSDFPLNIPSKSSTMIAFRILAPLSNDLFEKLVCFETNNKRQPLVSIRISGEPDRRLVITPTAARLGFIKAGNEIKKILKIDAEDSNNCLIKHVAASTPFLTPVLQKAEKEQGVWINMKVSPDTPRGEISEYIYLRTTIPERLNITVPVSVVIEKGVRIHPQSFYFGKVYENHKISRELFLNIIDSDWYNPKIEAKRQVGVEASLAKIDETTYKLKCSITPLDIPNVLNTIIRVKNSNGDSIDIPLIAVKIAENAK
jgi:hypothetical protein